VDGALRANVRLTQEGNTINPTPVTLSVGQVLRIALPAANKWGLTPSDKGAVIPHHKGDFYERLTPI
jgi:hypothetical protein